MPPNGDNLWQHQPVLRPRNSHWGTTKIVFRIGQEDLNTIFYGPNPRLVITMNVTPN